MSWKTWRASTAAILFGFVVLLGARAEEAKPKDEGKAEDYKSKAYDVKEKGEVAVLLTFPGGKKATLTVRCDKKSDVNLFVYNDAKKEVAKDDSDGPDCDVTFTPKEDGTFKLVIRNLGPGDNRATLKVDVAK